MHLSDVQHLMRPIKVSAITGYPPVILKCFPSVVWMSTYKDKVVARIDKHQTLRPYRFQFLQLLFHGIYFLLIHRSEN
jgi:hypothetical protein